MGIVALTYEESHSEIGGSCDAGDGSRCIDNNSYDGECGGIGDYGDHRHHHGHTKNHVTIMTMN